MDEKFEEWHKSNLVNLLNVIKAKYPQTLKICIAHYDEISSGN